MNHLRNKHGPWDVCKGVCLPLNARGFKLQLVTDGSKRTKREEEEEEEERSRSCREQKALAVISKRHALVASKRLCRQVSVAIE